MKNKLNYTSKLFALALLSLTAAAVIFYPWSEVTASIDPAAGTAPINNSITNNQPKVELVFVLDTTSSMSDLIDAAKEKIWSIATTMASAQPAPEISIGLVAFRDRGDAYITQVVDLSTDLDTIYAALMDFKTAGGGDFPESVNQALYDAVNHISWSQTPENKTDDTYKVIFLVGDAPPHQHYKNEVQYPDTMRIAQHKGIIVNTIQAGENRATTDSWKTIAALGTGHYFQVNQNGSALAVASPFDQKLADLSSELDETRLYYGSKEQLLEKDKKIAATHKITASASLASRARRAEFNVSESGKKNLLGDNELIDDVISGRVKLDAIDKNNLPSPMTSMTFSEQTLLIKDTADKRAELKQKIRQLSNDRNTYLNKLVEEEMGNIKNESLDLKLFNTLKSQAKSKGMLYDSDTPSY
ncbi:hypothetical protein MNBD_GAMMA16-1362 [hydrothermal vent metagenome]|uniref:VWFA domain-containing protein n=1 Tax=hydrothermal vent metagenome TaxID=652676 RepID=A0A3B0ZBE2_9ZZZZ